MTTLVTCTNCSKRKPITDFYKSAARKTGVGCWCKEYFALRHNIHQNTI